MNRRTFLFNTALGSLHVGLLGVPLRAFQPAPGSPPPLKIDIQAPEVPASPLAMPGLFPGRVVQAFHAGVLVKGRVSQPAVRAMLDQGMRALTGVGGKEAWAEFVEPSDVVALKVNPSGAPTTTTSIPLIREVIRALNEVGIPNRNIIVFDRNSNQMEVLGYHNLLPIGVRVVGLDRGWVVGREKSRVGYDPTVFAEMNCFGERETRSYMGTVVTREATKIINLPCLKEHNASGVTGCLKNLAYGCFNNVARTHRFPKTYTDPAIAVMCTAAPLRAKSVLHIMDGIRAVYHSGPFAWNPEFVWEAKTLLVGTDPVAMDRIELEIVEKKRQEVGAPSLWDRNPAHLGTTDEMEQTAQKSRFYREPNHIRTASELGLGRWELNQIDHRRLQVG